MIPGPAMMGPMAGAGAAATQGFNAQRLLPLLMGLGAMWGQQGQQQQQQGGMNPMGILQALGGGLAASPMGRNFVSMPQPFWNRGAMGPAG